MENRYWQFYPSLDALRVEEEERIEKIREEDQKKRGRYVLEGASVPLFFTLIAFGLGVYFSLKEQHGLAFWQHMQSGWGWVKYGLLLSAVTTGTSLMTFIWELGSVRGRWQFVGAAAFLLVLTVAVWLSSNMDEVKVPENQKTPGLKIHIEWTKKP